MNTNQQNAWRRITLPLTLACLFGIVVYATLTALPTAAANDLPNRANIAPRPTLLTDTLTYTIFLPIVDKPCSYQSTRPPLQGTTNFAGEVEIKTPLHCTAGWPTESPIVASGTYTNTPANVTLWVLAYPTPISRYYIQSPNACEGTPPNQIAGQWDVDAFLGEKGGDPEWFDLVVILADEEASQFLSKRVKGECENGQFVGLVAETLNQFAITEKGFISIQTKD